MAYYAVLASVVDLLQDKIHRHTYPSVSHGGRQMAMISLQQKFTCLLKSLKEYSSKGDDSSDDLERRIRDAAYQAQDIIEFATPGRISSDDEALLKVGQEIESIVKKMEIIKETQSLEDMQLGDVDVGGGVSEKVTDTRDTPVGFDANLETIKLKLRRDSPELQVIPIFGMGGIGKTTLARNTYEDGFIKNCFDSRAWVTVSQNYVLERLVRSLLESFGIFSKVSAIVEKEISIEVLEKREKILKKQVKTSTKKVKALEKCAIVDGKALEEEKKKVKGLKEQLMPLKQQLKALKQQLKALNEDLLKGIKKDKEECQGDTKEVEEDAEEDDETIEEEEDAGEEEEDTWEEGNAEELDTEKKALPKRMHHLYQYLCGRKYLVVIDDVWSTQVWDDIKHMFPNDRNGSGILVTTRLSNVADHTNSEFSHKMNLLTKEDSWKLFQTKLVKVSGYFPSELENIGRVIVDKCRGLPLAIVVMVGMLAVNCTLEYWQKVARNVGSALAESDDKHLPTLLSLSYNHLPHLQKACFLYMAIFPEGYKINISKLIRLWIAEGLFGSVDASTTLECVAKECLDDLVRRSLVTLAKRRADGTFKFCVIHDVLRDFCRERALSEYSVHVLDQASANTNPSGTKNVRRIIVDSFAPAAIPWTFDACKYIHTIQWFGRTTASSDVHRLDWGGFKHLKIMELSDAEISVAPSAVSRMFHLRYLALQLTSRRQKHIPPSIFKFRNLQTLIIYAPNCPNIELPAKIWEMAEIRHIVIGQMALPVPPMDGSSPLQKLEYLQTLQTVKNFTFIDEAIKIIPNLRILKISYEGEEANDIWRLYCLTNLVRLSQLEELKITFAATQFPKDGSFPGASKVFPHNLVKLSLVGCKLQWEGLTAAVKLLEKLQDLRLRANAVVGEKWELPYEWVLPKLRFLMMEELDLMYWEAEHSHFPCLEHLKVSKCHQLEKIPVELADIIPLKHIEVYNSKPAGDSVRCFNEVRREIDYDELQVDVRNSE